MREELISVHDFLSSLCDSRSFLMDEIEDREEYDIWVHDQHVWLGLTALTSGQPPATSNYDMQPSLFLISCPAKLERPALVKTKKKRWISSRTWINCLLANEHATDATRSFGAVNRNIPEVSKWQFDLHDACCTLEWAIKACSTPGGRVAFGKNHTLLLKSSENKQLAPAVLTWLSPPAST